MKKILLILIVCLCCSIELFAATLEVGSGKTYATINLAIAAASAGDTIDIYDGTYTDEITTLPNGSSGNYTIIKAHTDGGVIITGTMRTLSTSQYVQFEGLKWNYAGGKVIEGNHLKFLRCAFQGGGTSGYGTNVNIGTNDYPNATSYILMEDCWSYGLGGRYNFIAYLADHVIFRRCVVRHDGGYGPNSGNPEAGFSIYNSQYVELQNCIVIDSNLGTYVYWDQAFYIIYNSASAEDTSHISIKGCIAINNEANPYRFDGSETTISIDIWTDNVGITDGTKTGRFGVVNGGNGNITIEGGVLNSGFAHAQYGFGDYGGSGAITVDYNFLLDIDTPLYDGGFNDGGHNDTTPGADWLYPPKTESGTTGPIIIYRIGASGTLWGETGYTTETATLLWPWPYEDRIKTDMEAVDDRGFTAYSGLDGVHNTLTTYIWEYFENEIPADIYGDPPAEDTVDPVCAFDENSNPQTVNGYTWTGTGTCSDANGISAVKIRLTSAPDDDNGTLCTGTTSWSCTISGLVMGNNDVHVAGNDGTNWGDVNKTAIGPDYRASAGGSYNIR